MRGASDFVLKPVKALDIIARIKLHVRLVESRRENRQSTEEPVKGIGQGTLSLIEGYLRSVSEYQPVEAIAEGTGLAYQTTYRYLQYLVSVNRVEVSQHYGKVGAPQTALPDDPGGGRRGKARNRTIRRDKKRRSAIGLAGALIVRDRKSCGQNRQIKNIKGKRPKKRGRKRKMRKN